MWDTFTVMLVVGFIVVMLIIAGKESEYWDDEE